MLYPLSVSKLKFRFFNCFIKIWVTVKTNFTSCFSELVGAEIFLEDPQHSIQHYFQSHVASVADPDPWNPYNYPGSGS